MADDAHPEPGDEAEPFTLPLPPPLPADKDVVFFAHRATPNDREHEDIMLRRVPRDVAYQFRGAAGARGFTHAQYLAALVALHGAMRERADSGDAGIAAALDRLGLKTVSI